MLPYRSKQSSSAGVDWASFYYSPAICPSGWITATTFSASFGVFPSPKYLSLGPETSAALCCPSGYSYYENGPQCYSPITEEQLITYYSYLSDDNTWKKGTPTTTAWRVSTIIKGDGIPIFWQQSDSAVLARASVITMNPQATTVSTSSSTPVSPSVSPTTINTQTLSSNGLSTGAKIGLGVGIPLAIVVLLAIGLLLWRRQRKHKAVNTSDRVHDLVHQMDNKDALDAPAYVAQGQGAEIYGHEVQLQQPYYELQTSSDEHHSRHELPGVAHR